VSQRARLFLPPHARVLALPSAGRPRVYLASESAAQRWRHSGMYPAFRWTSRTFRVALRLKAALGLNRTRPNPSADWALGEFLQDCLPHVKATVVSLGTPGPAQKVTVQLWDGKRVVGYLKYGEAPAAMARLEQENAVLSELSQAFGPRVLKYDSLANGMALVTTPVFGKVVPTRVPPAANVRQFLEALEQPVSFPVDRHPWIQTLRGEHAKVVEPWLEPLAQRVWPVVVQHGDFAPWNVFQLAGGQVQAIDWEYGNCQGFPYLDLTYYLLQVTALINRWSPKRARAYVTNYLHKGLAYGLSGKCAQSIVKLSSHNAYLQTSKDGQGEGNTRVLWWRAIWENSR
jgi:hypothetical protein